MYLPPLTVLLMRPSLVIGETPAMRVFEMIRFCPMLLPKGSPFESNMIPRTRMRRLESLVVSKQNGELNSDKSKKETFQNVNTHVHEDE